MVGGDAGDLDLDGVGGRDDAFDLREGVVGGSCGKKQCLYKGRGWVGISCTEQQL